MGHGSWVKTVGHGSQYGLLLWYLPSTGGGADNTTGVSCSMTYSRAQVMAWTDAAWMRLLQLTVT